jgi:hypothetical protein
MKKPKTTSSAAAAAPVKERARAKEPATQGNLWKWGAVLAAFVVVFIAYGPALNAGFVFDDHALIFLDPHAGDLPFSGWMGDVRPLLMASYWVDYQISGPKPDSYHITNVLMHFATSILIALIVARLLELLGVVGRMRAALAIAAGAVFLLHPLQTEVVAYVASRSDAMSVMFYYAAYAVFLYSREERMPWWRALAVAGLFAGAAGTKEHTLTLPLLLVATDYLFGLGGLRKHWILYTLLAVGGVFGGIWVWRTIRGADTAGFHVAGLTPAMYFFTQCRVIWTYVRMFVLPFGQNIDPDVAVSQSLFDHGAIFGLIAWIAVAVAAFVYRKRYPLAAFGVFVFLLLLAPTSSFVPIRDVQAERRAYLPMLGLLLIAIEFARRVKLKELMWGGAAVALLLTILTYKRSEVWASELTLWTDATAKSPNKQRPRFHLASALDQDGRYLDSVKEYAIAEHLGTPDDRLYIDWGLALDKLGRLDEAAEVMRRGATLHPTADIYARLGMILAKSRKEPQAFEALAEAERLDRGLALTYVYRGNLHMLRYERAQAEREYQRALAIDPTNKEALLGMRAVHGQ